MELAQSFFLVNSKDEIQLMRRVTKIGSSLLTEIVAILIILDFIIENMEQFLQNHIRIFSDSRSTVGILTLTVSVIMFFTVLVIIYLFFFFFFFWLFYFLSGNVIPSEGADCS